jgi:hypothetical protein
MILYVNGDSHAAGAEAVNDYAFADEDIKYVTLGKRPHPDNLNVSWGMRLSKILNLGLKSDAESGGSNDRIIRTTNEFIDRRGDLSYPYTVVVIGWSTWEREEWYDEEENQWCQVNASGPGDLPQKWHSRYKQYVAGLEYRQKETEAHSKIYELHQKLRMHRIPHLFFNSNWHFSPNQKIDTNWRGCYLEPYNADYAYIEWATQQGFSKTKWNHFGPEAHRKWADLLSSRLTPLLQAV